MLTALLLSLLQSSPIAAPKPVEHPALTLPAPEWSFVPLTSWRDQPSTGVEALMYSVGIDAAVPVESSEVEADIYAEELP